MTTRKQYTVILTDGREFVFFCRFAAVEMQTRKPGSVIVYV